MLIEITPGKKTAVLQKACWTSEQNHDNLHISQVSLQRYRADETQKQASARRSAAWPRVECSATKAASAIPPGLAQWLVPNETHYSRITQEVAVAILLPAIYLN